MINSSDSRTKKIGRKAILTVVLFFISLLLLVGGLYASGAIKILQEGRKSQVKGATSEADVCKNKLNKGDIYLESSAKWYLKDYENTGAGKLNLHVDREQFIKPEKVYLVDTEASGTFFDMDKVNEKQFDFSPKNLNTGNYSFYAVAEHDCYKIRSEEININVSYPVMVLWTQDWEGDDVKQEYLDDITRISKQYGVVMTHYWNPRIYIENGMPIARQKYLTNWIKDRRDSHGEEIGLHIHMFDNLADTVGIEKLPERWGQRTDGYDRLTGQYSSEDFMKVLNWADAEFIENGFEKPKNFRAGGWFTSEETLEALTKKGYTIESSGREPYKIGANQKSGYWSLTDVSQPYYPSKTNQSIQDPLASRNWSILEVPNNAGNTWEHSAETINKRFDKNYAGGVSEKPVIFNILSHPHWHYMDGPKLDEIFLHTSTYNYSNDNGPVIYVTMEEAVDIWLAAQ